MTNILHHNVKIKTMRLYIWPLIKSKTKLATILKLCLVIVFVFYFQKIVFKNRKEKTIFLYFWNKKYVWLVERKKKIIFWRKKNYLLILMMLKQDSILFMKGKWKLLSKYENVARRVIANLQRSYMLYNLWWCRKYHQ